MKQICVAVILSILILTGTNQAGLWDEPITNAGFEDPVVAGEPLWLELTGGQKTYIDNL